jgi:hypothetical protein
MLNVECSHSRFSGPRFPLSTFHFLLSAFCFLLSAIPISLAREEALTIPDKNPANSIIQNLFPPAPAIFLRAINSGGACIFGAGGRVKSPYDRFAKDKLTLTFAQLL